MRWKISAHVDGGASGGSSMCRLVSKDPHRREQKFFLVLILSLEETSLSKQIYTEQLSQIMPEVKYQIVCLSLLDNLEHSDLLFA